MTNPNPQENLSTTEHPIDAAATDVDSAAVNNAADDAADSAAVADPTQWSRRTFALGVIGVFSAWIGAACNRLWGTPTPKPTISPLVPKSTRRTFFSQIATPTATSSAVRRPAATSLPTPLPTSAEQQTYLPVFESAENEAVAAAVPTETPTPEPPTATPTPTNTPTPAATPFPGGPPSKLGIHVERNVPELFQLLKTKAIAAVTTLELDAGFASQIKQASPSTKLIGRVHIGEVNLSTLNPTAAAADFVNTILPYADDDQRRPHFDGWIAYNEPVANNAEDMQRLADFEAERIRLLGDRGIRSVIGNFATGGPDLALWQHFLPAVQTAKEYGGWLGLHEYAAPSIYYLSTRENQGRYPGVSPQDEGWLTLRYRKVYNQFLKPANLAVPLVFTECGVDGLVQAGRGGPSNAKGWQHFQEYWAENGLGLWGPGAYIEQLVWFDQAMQQDDYVIGGCIYGLGTSSQWLSYDIKGPALGVLEQYLSVHAP